MRTPLLTAAVLSLALSAAAAPVVKTGKSSAAPLFAAKAAAIQSFQKQLGAMDLKTLGLPPGLVSALQTADPAVAEQRLLLAPLMLAYESGGAVGLGPRAVALLEAQAKASLSEGDLDRAHKELGLLAGVASSYGLTGLHEELAKARLRLEELHGVRLLRGARQVADELGGTEEERVLGAGREDETARLRRFKPAGNALEKREVRAPAARQEAPQTRLGRVRRFLRGLVSPWFPLAETKIDPDTPAFRGFRRFQAADFWGKTAAKTRAEIEGLRKLGSKKEAEAYARKVGDEVSAKLHAKLGRNIGFHYNMHSGHAEEYVKEGIRATLGDRVANRNTNPFTFDARDKVFFYHSPAEKLYDILDAQRMDAWPYSLVFNTRMGYLLTAFDMDAPELVKGMAEGKIALNTRSPNNMSWAFVGMKGVPYSAFVAPPLDVFPDMAAKLGMKGRLSRVEQNLAALRYLEAAMLSEERYLP